MSHRERHAWIRLVSLGLVFVPYFAFVLRLFEGDGPIGRTTCVAFLVAALAHGLLNGALQGIARIVFGAERADERDAAIDARSLRIAYFAIVALVLVALCWIAFLGAVTPPSSTGTILLPGFAATSQYVLWCLVVAEAARHLTQVVCYRRATA